MTSMLAFLATNWFATGELPQRTGNDHALASPYGLFQAADGEVAIAPSNDAFYLKLLAVLELEHLKDRPELRTNELRFANRAVINTAVNERTRTQPVAHWIRVLNEAGIPCGRVLNVAEVFADPQTRHQRMRLTIEHPRHGPLDVLGFPIKFTDEPCRVHRPPPDLGEDTTAVLGDLGYDAEAIARLRERGAV
jgi:crotonobetainyl-CoA:carnitine CoA-transferase CaiB-like acyl-CoA transferase